MELAQPITVFWDIALDESAVELLQQICTDILAVRPLMLQLYDPSSSLGDGVCAVLEQLRGQPVAVTLIISPACLSNIGDAGVSGFGVKEILLVVERPDELKKITTLLTTGLYYPVTEKNWRELPALVAGCRESGFERLVLPMQRLYNKEKPFMLTKAEQKELEMALSAVGGTKDLKLTIHDPFLWKAFNPGVPFPQGGCQAANTMIAISTDAGVYPCPTLPVRLGVLGDESLRDILASSRKKDFRRSLLLHPDACRECPEIAECKGGCRGRSYVMHGSLDDIDDSCR